MKIEKLIEKKVKLLNSLADKKCILSKEWQIMKSKIMIAKSIEELELI